MLHRVTQILLRGLLAVVILLPLPLLAVPLEIDRLPSLHTPRAGHLTFAFGDELMVVGGHTSGFVPTATAEFFRDGQWQEVKTIYDHDHAFAVQMQSGRVLIAGGHLQQLGIGQSFTVELLNSSTHTFEGYGCLDRKRCFATGIEMDSGRVVITGNWYAEDGVESFDGGRQFMPVKEASVNRALPYILRTSQTDVIIFSSVDEHGQPVDTIVVDRLHGQPYTEPLLQVWCPIKPLETHRSTDYFIGNEAAGDYSYLVAATDTAGRVGVVRVSNGVFSLLPTTEPIPIVANQLSISYFSTFVADRAAGRAYLVGRTADGCHCVACVEYAKNPAPVTFYCSEPMPDVGASSPVLTRQGDLALLGGITDSNFNPTATAVILHVASRKAASAATDEPSAGVWMWLFLIAAVAAIGMVLLMNRPKQPSQPTDLQPLPKGSGDVSPLLARLCQLMEEEKIYRNSELKLQDVADRLGSNRTYIADCIKVERGLSFPMFVNTYRVEYAKQLLSSHPEMKSSAVGTESGFSSEASFYRQFKAVTGMTPKEWLAQQQG